MEATTRAPDAAWTAGRFHGLRRLGAGATASVYSALEARSGGLVAVKVLHPTLARDQAWRDRFLTEATLLARVRHPSVPRLLAVGDRADRPWYAMELAAGTSLAERLAAGPLPAAEVAAIGAALADALAALHAAGIVHADVKPANVVLRPGRPAALVDFGAAHVATEPAPGGEREVFGTLGYVAPEVLLDGAVPDARADLFALGATLHAAVTGVAPEEGDADAVDAALVAAARPALDPREVLPGCPERLADAIVALTRRRPERRPGSATAARALLETARNALLYPHAA